MNTNKKTKNVKTNKAISNAGNSNSIDALNEASGKAHSTDKNKK